MPPRNQLIACVIRQYDAGLYRAWVSLDRGHMVCLGAYQDEANATETIDRFLDTYRDGRIKTPEDILPHIASSCAQDLTAPLLVVGRGVGPEIDGKLSATVHDFSEKSCTVAESLPWLNSTTFSSADFLNRELL